MPVNLWFCFCFDIMWQMTRLNLLISEEVKQHGMADRPNLNNNSSFFNIPSFKEFPDHMNTSLKFINTIYNIPYNTFDNLEKPNQDCHNNADQDSLADRISLGQTVTGSAKKKKAGCTCKKTFCLKMYCECFSSNKMCTPECACCGCRNLEQHQEQIQKAKTSIKEGGLKNCSLSAKRCNCKKSQCLKRYCECYNSGVGCSPACKCIDCMNKETHKSQESVEDQSLKVVPPELEKQEAVQPINILQKSIEDLERFYS